MEGRREFLRHCLAGVLTAGLGPGLAACGRDRDDDPEGLGTLVHQLSWLPGPWYGGSYLAAEAGVYQEVGFEGGVELLYGGPNVAVEPVVQQGRAFLGLTNSEKLAAAVRQGARLSVIGAYYQRNPFCIVSLPEDPIATPTDMVGRRIGIQAVSETLWSVFLGTNGIDPSSTEKVVVQYDLAPLLNGEVDGFLSFVDNEAVTLSVVHGMDPVVMMLADHGVPLYQALYIVADDALQDDRRRVLAAIRAEVMGKQMLLADPEEAIRLAMEKYAVDQDIDAQWARLSLERARELVVTPSTEAHGLMSMTGEDIDGNLETLTRLGLEVPRRIYAQTILEEVYADGIDLIS